MKMRRTFSYEHAIGQDHEAQCPVIMQPMPSNSPVVDPFAGFDLLRKNDLSSMSKSARIFYNDQNAVIDGFHEAYSGAVSSENEREGGWCFITNSNRATTASIVVNVLLTIIKIAALSLSGSLAVLGSLVDSALDLFSGTVIYFTSRFMARHDRYNYPIGKTRFEPIATIIIATVMGTAAVEIFSRAVEQLASSKANPSSDVATKVLLAITVGSKLVLYVLCRRIPSTSAQTLATDHLNDTFSNAVALVFSSLAVKYWRNLDPIGAIMIALFILVNWIREGREHVKQLGGLAGSNKLLQQLTFVAMNHHPDIIAVDTVRAFHSGANTIVEVDIVLAPDMPLRTAHDIGESLQKRLELVESVDRAFVHLDTEVDHDPSTEHKLVAFTAE